MTNLCQLNHTAAFQNARRAAQRPLPSPNLQHGASLLEGIAYLGIAAVVVLGAVSLLGGAFSSAKSNQAMEEAVALRTAVRKLYIGQTYPTDGIVKSLIAANAVPGTLAKGAGDTLVNSWGGIVAVSVATGGFEITYPSVPKDVCINMISGTNGWIDVTQDKTTKSTFPLSASDATDLCGGKDGVNILKFKSM